MVFLELDTLSLVHTFRYNGIKKRSVSDKCGVRFFTTWLETKKGSQILQGHYFLFQILVQRCLRMMTKSMWWPLTEICFLGFLFLTFEWDWWYSCITVYFLSNHERYPFLKVGQVEIGWLFTNQKLRSISHWKSSLLQLI